MRSGVPGHGRLAKEKLFLQREESNAGWSRNRLLLSTTRYELAKEYTMESGNDWRFEGGVARGAEIEILQMFSPGRYAEFGDILADAAGALIGGAIAITLRRGRVAPRTR